MNFFIIDVECGLPRPSPPPGIGWSPAGRHQALIKVLPKLKDTVSCTDGGRYHQELSCAQIHLTTTWSQEKLESWMYTNKAAEFYIGCIQKNEMLETL